MSEYDSEDDCAFLKQGKLGGLGTKKPAVGSFDNAHPLDSP